MKSENHEFEEKVMDICDTDSRYDPDAYYFLQEALADTLKGVAEKENGKIRHVSGQELCEGIRRYAIEQFGPMAYTVFAKWGLHSTSDIGEIVYNMIAIELLSKQGGDKRSDFDNVYDFAVAFLLPYFPKY